MTSAKRKIKKCVVHYVEYFQSEYVMFQEAMERIRHSLSDEQFAQANQSGMEMRGLFEMPVTLHEMIVNSLTEDELDWFKSGGADHKEGARWFATSFPAFRIPASV